MSFADEVRKSYQPKANKVPPVISDEDIMLSARDFVETVKQRLLEASKDGLAGSKKKGLFSKRECVEYKTSFIKNEYVQLPELGNYEGEPNYSYWSVPKDNKVMETWQRVVNDYLKENGIEHEIVGNKYATWYCYYIWI